MACGFGSGPVLAGRGGQRGTKGGDTDGDALGSQVASLGLAAWVKWALLRDRAGGRSGRGERAWAQLPSSVQEGAGSSESPAPSAGRAGFRRRGGARGVRGGSGSPGGRLCA